MEKTVSDAITFRRSVRIFEPSSDLDQKKVRACLENAVLAPNSSNLQLWEFYHIVDADILKKMTRACLGQNAAKTAKQMVVVVVRKDLWRKRSKANIEFYKHVLGSKLPSEYSRREKFVFDYYGKVIPSIYMDFLGILGWAKYIIFSLIGIFRPIYKQVRLSDMRIVAHKSAGLAAQNFMISMAAIGYDTCPMEGSDSGRVKKILGLPRSSEINMVIGCGIREEKGIYGPQFRIPFDQVYTKV